MKDEFEDLRAKALETAAEDALARAEEITGQSYKESMVTRALGMALHLDKAKRERSLMSELGDTYYGLEWDEFVKTITDYGFVLIMYLPFAYRPDHREKTTYPYHMIAAHPTKKLLLAATSYITDNSQIVNGGKVYGTVSIPEDTKTNRWQALAGCSHSRMKKDRVEFDYDIRTGLISKLIQIESASGGFVDWKDADRFLWLMNYAEEHEQRHDHEPLGLEYWRINRDVFMLHAPKWVRQFTGFTFWRFTASKLRLIWRCYRNSHRRLDRTISKLRYKLFWAVSYANLFHDWLASRLHQSTIAHMLRAGYFLSTSKPEDDYAPHLIIGKENIAESVADQHFEHFETTLLDIRKELLFRRVRRHKYQPYWRDRRSYITRWIEAEGLMVVKYDPAIKRYICELTRTEPFEIPTELKARVVANSQPEAWSDRRGFTYDVVPIVSLQGEDGEEDNIFQVRVAAEQTAERFDPVAARRFPQVTYQGRARSFWGAIGQTKRQAQKKVFNTIL